MLNTQYIRNDDRRKKFVESHELKPVFRRVLKPTEQVRCVCRNPVEGEIYFIEAIERKTGEAKSLFVGTGCGGELLRLAEMSKPPLFNLFKSDSGGSDTSESSQVRKNPNKNTLDFCALNEEMYNAIGILCESWNISFPENELLKLLLFITKNPRIPTKDWAVLKFNGMVGKDREGRRLVQMLTDLRQSGKELKYFTFHNMNRIINQSNYPNNIE